MTNKTKEVWPKVEIGTHFAVIHYEDGTHEMHWDDDKLLEEVRAAIASVSTTNKAERSEAPPPPKKVKNELRKRTKTTNQ